MVGFEKDIFISYAHIDNQPLTPGQKDSISRFHASLEVFLSTRIGQSARIWRDDKLQGNDVFANEIMGRCRRSQSHSTIRKRGSVPRPVVAR